MTVHSRHARLARAGTLVAAALMTPLMACTPTLPAPTSNYDSGRRLVFPVIATGPGTLDGLANEAAWTASSFKFLMVHGGPSATVFRGVADANFLYIYGEVEDTQFNAADVLVIGLNPSNGANDYRRIHIFPCPTAGQCAANGNAQTPTVQYWKDGTFANPSWTFTSDAVPAGLEARVATATAGSLKTWAVEVKIPRGAPFNLVDTNFFGLFVDVVRTDPDLVEAVQYTWPADRLIAGPDENDVLANLEGGTPAPNQWGNATLNAGFGNGVSIYSNDISSSNSTDSTVIQINSPNTFYGTASNYSTQGGTLVAANAVKATFKIANFGFGSYTNVPPAGSNPTAATNIAATSAFTYNSGVWNLSNQEKTDYTANPHQCIQVELTSTDANTVFVNAMAQRNMDFVMSNSPFQRTALLTTKGREGGGERRIGFTLRETFINFDPRLTWTTKIDNATPAGPGVYRAQLGAQSDVTLGITVEPPKVQIPSESIRIPAGTGGQRNPAVRFPVRPGDVVTVISEGMIEINGQQIGAGGLPMGDRRGESKVKNAGAMRIGALLGSFDDFKNTAFVIGNAATLRVPGGAQALAIKINDDPNQYDSQKGDGFVLQVVRTAVEPWMAAANPELRKDSRGDDVFVTLGANLPTWMLRGERDTGRVIRIGRETYRAYQSIGMFGHIVRRIN